jgi:hypothetical protein
MSHDESERAQSSPVRRSDETVERSSLVRAVQTPLAFYVLVVLIVETLVGALAWSGPEQTRPYLMAGMLVVLVIVCITVAWLASHRLETLLGFPAGSSPVSVAPDAATTSQLRPGTATVLDPNAPVRINFREGGRRGKSGLVTSEALEARFDGRVRCLLHIQSREFRGGFIVALSANCTSVSFGTDPSCDVVVDDSELSRTHFKLLLEPVESADGAGPGRDARVQLLDTAGATYVDEEIVEHKKVQLPDACSIRAGRIEIWFWRLMDPTLSEARSPTANEVASAGEVT